MRVIFLLMVCSLAVCFLFETTKDTIEVDVIEIQNEGQEKSPYGRTKRRARMAKHKKFEFVLEGRSMMLNLTLNDLVRDHAPMYLLQDGKNIKVKRTGTDERYGFYQDRHTRASILVKCMKDVCKPVYGHFRDGKPEKIQRKFSDDKASKRLWKARLVSVAYNAFVDLGSFTVSGRQYLLDLAHRAVESKSLLTPVERHPEMKISMEGDMVFYKSDSLTAAVQKQTNDSRRIESDVHVIPGSKTTPQHQGSKHRSNTRIIRGSEKGIPIGTDIVEIMVYTDEMDQVYQGFQDHPSNAAGLAIRLSFSGILIACDSAGAPWSTNRTNASSDLSDFATWQNNLKLKLNLKYDIAMGISGNGKNYVMEEPVESVTFLCVGNMPSSFGGVAFAHAICDEQVGANIIYDTKFSTWLMTTAVHELGHNLGATHDQSHGCSGGFLMSVNAFTANASTATTQYEFTSCAIRTIERIITNLGSSRCTLNHNFNDTQYDRYRAGAIGGDVVSLDFQCQVYYGSGSFACLKNNDTMCYRGVTCQSSTGCKGRLQLVKEHTECNTNKWCSKGKCVDKSTSGTDIPGTCFVHKICTVINNLPIGEGCCQGFTNTSCCTLDKNQTSCSVQIPC